MIQLMLLHKQMELIRLHLRYLYLSHRLGIELKQLLDPREIPIPHICFHLVQEVLKGQLGPEVIGFLVQVVLGVVVLLRGRHWDGDGQLLGRV